MQLLEKAIWLAVHDNNTRDLPRSYKAISEVLIDKYSHCSFVNSSDELFRLYFLPQAKHYGNTDQFVLMMYANVQSKFSYSESYCERYSDLKRLLRLCLRQQ